MRPHDHHPSPIMVGTPKQVAWAEDIKAGALAGWATLRAQLVAGIDRDERVPALLARGDELAAELEANTDAKWWIDNRDRSVQSVRELLAQEVSA